MPDWPQDTYPPIFMHNGLQYGMGFEMPSSTPFNSTSFGISTAIYVPMQIPMPYPVKRVFWTNGTSSQAMSVDFGIYTPDGRRIYSTGSTTAVSSTVAAPQYTSVATPFMLSPGQYFFAYAMTSTGTANRTYASSTQAASAWRSVGYLQQGIFPLPAQATFATLSHSIVPLIGVTLTETGH